ncbi:hypothetical protein HZ326_29232 [Fusarium oxysporum f. sp. albedinis]|nr:hypothetical protein HZ326_29232 [Fusarium oxysporum f. sp. albedinis]
MCCFEHLQVFQGISFLVLSRVHPCQAAPQSLKKIPWGIAQDAGTETWILSGRQLVSADHITEDLPVIGYKSWNEIQFSADTLSCPLGPRGWICFACVTMLGTPGFCLGRYLQLCLSGCNYLLQAFSVFTELSLFAMRPSQ